MQATIAPADPDDPQTQDCWAAYFALLVASIPDLPAHLFPLPDPHAASYRPPHGVHLLARAGDLPVGCVSLRPLTPGLAEVKRLWVAPQARGQGLARRLMQAIETGARSLDYTTLNLDTHHVLTDAMALYQKTGWTPIPAYSGYPSTRWFTKHLA